MGGKKTANDTRNRGHSHYRILHEQSNANQDLPSDDWWKTDLQSTDSMKTENDDSIFNLWGSAGHGINAGIPPLGLGLLSPPPKPTQPSPDTSQLFSYIKSLESRVAALEQDNQELREKNLKHNNKSAVAVLSAQSREFSPSLSSSSISAPSSLPPQKGQVIDNDNDNDTGNDDDNDTNTSTNTPSLVQSVTKIQERLSTLEGRQSSMQKKISSLDTALGPSVASWSRSIKEAISRLENPLYSPPVSGGAGTRQQTGKGGKTKANSP
jgi:hypothetical protein